MWFEIETNKPAQISIFNGVVKASFTKIKVDYDQPSGALKILGTDMRAMFGMRSIMNDFLNNQYNIKYL